MLQDLRYGIRILLKKPGFTLIAVLSLAFGIGANTAIFSLLDAVLVRNLPVPRPEKLVLFGNGKDQGGSDSFPDKSTDLFSYAFYRRAEERHDLFSGVASVLSLTWTVPVLSMQTRQLLPRAGRQREFRAGLKRN
jgi:hypothetical protein